MSTTIVRRRSEGRKEMGASNKGHSARPTSVTSPRVYGLTGTAMSTTASSNAPDDDARPVVRLMR